MEKRQSRQNIVVPPKGVSATSMIIGAVLCGLAGFAVVWLAGLGRTVSVTQSPMPTASASTTGPSLLEESSPPVRLEPTANLEQSRFSSPAQETYVNPPRGGDYPTQPASFEKPIEAKAAASEKAIEEEQGKDDAVDAEPNHLSRFSAKQISPPEGEVAKQQLAAPELDEKLDEKNGDSRAEKITETARAPALTGHGEKINEESTPSVLQQPTEDDELGTKQINEKLVGMKESSAPSPPVLVRGNEPSIDNEKEAAAFAVSVEDASSPDQPEVLATEIAKKKVASKTKATDDVAAAAKKADETTLFAKPAPETNRSKKSANKGDKGDLVEAEPTQTTPSTPEQKTSPPSLPALDDAKGTSPPQPLVSTNTEEPLSAQSNPFAAPKQTSEASANDSKKPPLQNTGVTMPFAAAPPLGKQQQNPLNTIDADKKAEPLSKTTPAQSGASGQGRPGLPQIEGLQTPQLTLEKSGPRDLQVGKPARFEVIIRNVGAATAHDTVLRDAVPYGTSLITTMPPASPGGPNTPSGELLWAIGELKAGQEARVAMEVMPQLEGDIGSVASVTFRADATVRSRVTKPALEIVAEPPQPTLVGEMMAVDISLSNPGTGTATGVIVEGILPDSVSHPAGREVEFDVGQLEPGSSRSISLKLATITPGVHEIRIGARADGGIEVSRPLRAEITAPVLELHADIPKRRYLQRPATCTLNMHNTGTAPALAVELAAQLPAGMKFVRANNAGYYDEKTHRVLWSLEELPAGELGTVEFVAMPTVLGPQTIVAAVRNPAGLADQLSHTIEVEGLASLALEVADSEDPIEINGLTEYVVRVANQGTKAATNVALSAKLLGDLQPVEARGPVPYEVQNLMITFEPLASLAPADEAVFHVQVRGRRPGNQRVQFQLQSDDLQTPLTSEEMTHVYADR
ncbi:MAG: hypothetical protein ACPGMQ_11430 [Pirellulales bacterium]|jgi:uncharacterized repeat protein (TIGR01451 family)